MENLDPPSLPKIKDEKTARFCPSRGFVLDLGGGGGEGGLLFHFIVSKITHETTCHANFKIHEQNPTVLPFKRNLFG